MKPDIKAMRYNWDFVPEKIIRLFDNKGEKMIINMKLKNEPFVEMATGNKTVELRLLDDKRKQISIGDQIRFVNIANESQTLLTKVTKLTLAETFEDLFEKLNINNESLGFSNDMTTKDMASAMSQYYTAEEQLQYGVIGITIEVICDLPSWKNNDFYTLEEYKKIVRFLLKRIDDELLTDAKSDEFYYVEMCYCEGDDGPVYTDAFKKRDNMIKYIAQSENYVHMFLEMENDDEEYEEELEESTYYWVISKYKLTTEGDYGLLFSVKWQNYGVIGLTFGFELFAWQDKFLLSDSEKKLIEEVKNIQGDPFSKIVFPYSRGDIIKIDNMPFSKEPSYFVFLGISDKILMYDYEGDLSIEHAFSASLNNVEGRFLPCYYNRVDFCVDDRIQHISNHIKTLNDNEIKSLIETFDYTGMDIESLNERDKRLKALEDILTEEKGGN